MTGAQARTKTVPMDTRDPAHSENLRHQLARSDESVCVCSVCDEWLTEGKDGNGDPICEECAADYHDRKDEKALERP